MKAAHGIFIIGCGLLLGACTNQGAYAGLQNGQREQCQKMPEATAREQCLRDADKSYEQYRREREDALHGQQ